MRKRDEGNIHPSIHSFKLTEHPICPTYLASSYNNKMKDTVTVLKYFCVVNKRKNKYPPN